MREQLEHGLVHELGVRTLEAALSPPASAPFTSPFKSDANGACVFHSGCCGASAFTRSSAKTNWK
jgi:hypothetical protein